MLKLKERLKCQHCDSNLLEREGDVLTCIFCGREHDSKGKLIRHPVPRGRTGHIGAKHMPRLIDSRALR